MDKLSKTSHWRGPTTGRAAGAAVTDGSQDPANGYSPYSVDWRFLPEDALIVKDFIRYHIVRLNAVVAMSQAFSPVWAATVGQRTLGAILAAKVLFVHVPKTGGTSICKVLYGRNLPHFTADFHYRAFGSSIATLPSFSVLRHPLQRLMSCYRFTISGGTEIMASNRFERRRLKGLESFDSFVDYLFETRDRLSTLPNTFHEQATFILDGAGRVLTGRLFCLDLEGRLPPELNRWLGTPSIPHLNATVPTPITVSQEIEDKVRSLYARDFQIYDLLRANGGHADMKGRVVLGQ